MTRDEVRWGIKRIIAQVAGIPLPEMEDEHRLRDELMLDSLKEMEIVARTEIHFDISLDESDLLRLRTLGDYCDLVTSSLGIPPDKQEG